MVDTSFWLLIYYYEVVMISYIIISADAMILEGPQNVIAIKGRQAVLTCNSKQILDTIKWSYKYISEAVGDLRSSVEISSNTRGYTVKRNGNKDSSLVIHSISEEHAGLLYTCSDGDNEVSSTVTVIADSRFFSSEPYTELDREKIKIGHTLDIFMARKYIQLDSVEWTAPEGISLSDQTNELFSMEKTNMTVSKLFTSALVSSHELFTKYITTLKFSAHVNGIANNSVSYDLYSPADLFQMIVRIEKVRPQFLLCYCENVKEDVEFSWSCETTEGHITSRGGTMSLPEGPFKCECTARLTTMNGRHQTNNTASSFISGIVISQEGSNTSELLQYCLREVFDVTALLSVIFQIIAIVYVFKIVMPREQDITKKRS